MESHTDTPPPHQAAPRARPSLDRIRRSPLAPKLVFESLLIVASVLLGLALNEWREDREERALARAALVNFRQEIEFNLGELTRRQPVHAAMAGRLAATRPAAGQTAFQAFRAQMPAGGRGLDNAPLRDAAWQTATSTAALRLLPYEQAALLSHTYLVQRSVSETTRLLGERFASPENFDPSAAAAMLQTHARLVDDMSGQESYIMGEYRRALAQLGEVRR